MVVMSSGQIVNAASLGGFEYAGTESMNAGVVQLLTRSASYSEIYRSQPWVAALVNKVAAATARLPLVVYEREDRGRTKRAEHPFMQLLENPNPREDGVFFMLQTVSTFELYGEALWAKSRPGPGQPPTSLWQIHPANVTTSTREDGRLVYRWWPHNLEFDPDDIVHFRSYNPDDYRRGLSRLEPLRTTLTSEESIQAAQEAIWRNGARPSVLLQHPKAVGKEAGERLRAQWERLQTGIDNWGRTAILEEGMTANVVQLSAADMEVTDFRRLSREEACGVYDVPPPVVHILDRATFSNITEQMRSMYRDTMAPRLRVYESAIDKQLRPDFDVGGSLYAEFLMDEVLRGDFESRVDSYQKGITSGWLSPAEVRQMENLPDAGPEADRLYVNAALVPMSSQPSTPRVEQNTQTRSVMGRLGNVDTPDEVDVDTLTRGLPNEVATALRARVDSARALGADMAALRAAVATVLEGDCDV